MYICFSNDRQAGQQSTERRRGGWGRGCSGRGQCFPTTGCHGQLEEGGSNQHEGPGTGKCARGEPFLFQASNTLSWKRKLSGYHHRVGLDSYIAVPQSQALQYCSLIMPEDKATVYIYIHLTVYMYMHNKAIQCKHTPCFFFGGWGRFYRSATPTER